MKTTLCLLCLWLTISGSIIGQSLKVIFEIQVNSEKIDLITFSKYDFEVEKFIVLKSLDDITINEPHYFEDRLIEPSIYTLKINSGKEIRMAVEQSGLVKLQISDEILLKSEVARTSDFSQSIQDLNLHYFADLIGDYDKALNENDHAAIAKLEKKKSDLMVDFVNDMEDMVRQMGASALAYDALAYFDVHKNHSFLQEMLQLFKIEFPNAGMSKSLETRIAKAAQVGLGNVAPDFTTIESQGMEVRLSDFKGSLLLVDFWASWCRACRVENPKFVDLYQSYANKGFEIISISIDSDSTTWKKAIKTDALLWTQILDSDHSIYTQYMLSSLPSNFLLDHERKIIARNLTADELKSKLDQMLSKKALNNTNSQ